MVLERLSWLVTGPSNASFCLLMVARGGPYGPTGKLTLLRNPVVGLVLREGDAEKFPHALVSKAWIFFSVSQQGSCFRATEDGSDKRLTELELA